MLERIVGFAPVSSILDVGSSSGPNLYHLAKEFPNTLIRGIDVNPYAVEYGNRRFAEEGVSNVKLSETRC